MAATSATTANRNATGGARKSRPAAGSLRRAAIDAAGPRNAKPSRAMAAVVAVAS